MYSLILMTAVASSGDTSNFHFRWHRGGCYGCVGVPVAYVPVAPVTYTHGPYGPPAYVVGGYPAYSGCGGGCWSSWNASFYSGYSCGGCGGGCIGYSTIPSVIYGSGDCCGALSMASPTAPTAVLEKPTRKGGVASITIELPANAQLYVDGQLVPGTGTVRSFTTPTLPGGQAFAYEMKADLMVEGNRIQEDLKVVVHAEDKLTKSFGELLAAAKRDKSTDVAKK